MTGVLLSIGRGIFELITFVGLVKLWFDSGRAVTVAGPQWCAGRRLDRRDLVVIGCTVLMFVWSFGTWYSPTGGYLDSNCQSYDIRGGGAGTAAPGALCRVVNAAYWRRNAWAHFMNWAPIVLQVLIVLVVLVRAAGWCAPVAARVITRFFMFLASLAAVASIYGEPVLKFTTRGWCLWAATVLTTINLFTIIRSQSWTVRWMTQ